jgi:hypothetical protein
VYGVQSSSAILQEKEIKDIEMIDIDMEYYERWTSPRIHVLSDPPMDHVYQEDPVFQDVSLPVEL